MTELFTYLQSNVNVNVNVNLYSASRKKRL